MTTIYHKIDHSEDARRLLNEVRKALKDGEHVSPDRVIAAAQVHATLAVAAAVAEALTTALRSERAEAS